ncbi:MAG: TlpA disulfide reductase family protein [Anaerolineae bacterium]
MGNKARRWLTALLTVAAAVLLGGLGLWALTRPARPLPSEATPAVATPVPKAPLGAVEPVAASDVVAWIDGAPLPLAALTQRQAIDRALNALLDIPATDEATALDRLVNEALLLRAAEAAGFRITAETVTAEREALLAAYGKSTADLEAALQAEGFPLAAFDAYLSNLIVARDFSAAQAQARGITVEAFILELRAAHDVRFHTADVAALPESPADMATPAVTAAPAATATPEATPTALPPTSTPTEIPPTPTDDAPRGTGVGQRAPAFALPLLGSEPLTTLALDMLRGKPVVLSFWVTWCGHCRAQTPLLVDAHARYGAEVQFVGVNVQEIADVVQPYVTGQGILYPVVMDAEGRTAQQYQVSGFPTTYFLDAEGRVVARHVGELNAPALEQYLDLLH